MRIPTAFIAALILLAAPLLAQPAPPIPQRVAELRAMAQVRPLDVTPLTVNLASRENVRQFYRAIYGASDNVPMGWTGNYDTGDAGDISDAYKAATLLRINFFRALVGVPASIALNDTYSAEDQQAALMMSANNELSHSPDNTWTDYTADGAAAAASSNISLGSAGPDAITGYMGDGGTNNTVVGHRRWLIYPQTQEMGTGSVPGVSGNNNLLPANATWIFDGNYGGPRPILPGNGLPYPPAGYVPYTLVWPRWSFTYPDADFSSATVTATQDGQPLAVASTLASNSSDGIGEPAIIWVFNGVDANSNDSFARPSADTTYAVTVSNVLVSGTPQNFSYSVTVFDPDVPGPDYAPVAITGSATPLVGAPNTYTVAMPSFADSLDWRTLQLAAFSTTYDAETGLEGLVASTSPGYSVVESSVVGAGTASYNLAHNSPADQFLTLPVTFYVASGSASITFLSRLGFAATDEVAHVQISADDGTSWSDVFVQAGTGGAGESNFTSHNVSLSAFTGSTVLVRFAYTLPVSASWFNPSPGVGWYLDNITLTGVQSVTAGTPTDTGGANTFSITPASAGAIGLQARGVLFDSPPPGYPLGWGPVDVVTATNAPAFSTQPASQSATAGGAVTLSSTVTGASSYQWQLNGLAVTGATSSSLPLANLDPAHTGLYSVAATNAATTVTSNYAIVGVLTTSPAIGDGTVLATNILHPNGNHYDQVLLTGPAGAVTTQGGRVTRTSFIDENDDIVQVEFAGAGTLSLVLDDPSGPAPPLNYNQPTVSYMKGHVGLVIAGANETTNISVFTVGRATAFDPTGNYNILLPANSTTNNPADNGSPLFIGHSATLYDGVADIAFIAIGTTDGKFGGLRASNARCEAVNGLTGIYAPGVQFLGPVFIGNIDAAAAATPALIIGATTDARITGGNLQQANGSAVQVSGLTQLKFTAGSNSGGTLLPAQANQAVLEQNGTDVTAQIVVNP